MFGENGRNQDNPAESDWKIKRAECSDILFDHITIVIIAITLVRWFLLQLLALFNSAALFDRVQNKNWKSRFAEQFVNFFFLSMFKFV